MRLRRVCKGIYRPILRLLWATTEQIKEVISSRWLLLRRLVLRLHHGDAGFFWRRERIGHRFLVLLREVRDVDSEQVVEVFGRALGRAASIRLIALILVPVWHHLVARLVS